MANAAEKLKAEREKSYKTSHDVQRVHHLIGALTQLRDHTGAQALASSLARELRAMSLKQEELDAEEKASDEREARAHAPAPTEEEKKSDDSPTRAPSVPRR